MFHAFPEQAYHSVIFLSLPREHLPSAEGVMIKHGV